MLEAGYPSGYHNSDRLRTVHKSSHGKSQIELILCLSSLSIIIFRLFIYEIVSNGYINDSSLLYKYLLCQFVSKFVNILLVEI